MFALCVTIGDVTCSSHGAIVVPVLRSFAGGEVVRTNPGQRQTDGTAGLNRWGRTAGCPNRWDGGLLDQCLSYSLILCVGGHATKW
jgi:hypothetical protein